MHACMRPAGIDGTLCVSDDLEHHTCGDFSLWNTCNRRHATEAYVYLFAFPVDVRSICIGDIDRRLRSYQTRFMSISKSLDVADRDTSF